MNRDSHASDAPVPTGNLFVVAAPSGGGKTSIVNALLERDRAIRLSVSYTTRPPRPGEVDGVHYHFVDEPRFMALMAAGEFLEHAHVHGNWYATSSTLAAAQQVERRPRRAARNRLAGRRPGSRPHPVVGARVHPAAVASPRCASGWKSAARTASDVIARRLDAAQEEMRHCGEFDYVIINQDFATAVADLAAVVRASRLRAAQQRTRHSALVASLLAPRS